VWFSCGGRDRVGTPGPARLFSADYPEAPS
jgi:hypothetical protein